MRSYIAKGLFVLTLGSMVMLAYGNRASAEPLDQRARLLGTWRVQVTLVDCQTGASLSPSAFPSLLTFALGGTMAEDTSNPGFGLGQRSAGQGEWHYKGGGAYEARSVAFITYTTPANPVTHNPGFEAGEQIIQQTIRFQNDRNAWSSTAEIVFTDATGTVYRSGCAVATAQRF
jgi:hypothetical protein